MEFTFDIAKFVVGEYNAYYNSYNAFFKEYYIPSEYENEIKEVKESDMKVFQLADGSIHFSKVEYENIIKERVS